MNPGSTFEIESNSLEDTLRIAESLGAKLRGGEVIELVSDVGGGKTAFVRGLAKGIGSPDQVQSPTFTISRIYKGKDLEIHHFDFYRLDDPGVMAQALAEVLEDPKAVVVVEWGEIVNNVLPEERLRIKLEPIDLESRHLLFEGLGSKYEQLVKSLP